MKIVRNYYQRALEQEREIEKAIAREASGMTREECLESEDELRKGAEAIRAAAPVRVAKIPDQRKIDRFLAVSRRALDFAEYMACDVLIESDLKTAGKIMFKFARMVFDKEIARAMLLPFCADLSAEAEYILCSAEGDLIQSEYRFNLTV